MFYKQVQMRNGLPFDAVIPNDLTRKPWRIQTPAANLVHAKDANDMFKKLGILMLTPVYARQFERDLKRMLKRGKDAERFKTVARLLLWHPPLLPKHKDHKLSGSYSGRGRDCHIENDWVLIYKKETTAIIFERTGTHSDRLNEAPTIAFTPYVSPVARRLRSNRRARVRRRVKRHVRNMG